MFTHTRLTTFLIALAFLLSACTGTPAERELTTPPESTETRAPAPTDTVEATLPPTTPPEAQPRPNTTPITTEPLLSLRQRLAEQLGYQEAEIGLLDKTAVTWSDGCLGAAKPGEMCTMALVTGYLIYFDTPGGKIEVHTDENMRAYRIVSSLIGGDSSPLVSWNRTGGIAGICWQMDIYMNGAYQILDCSTQQTLAEGSLPQTTLIEIMELAKDMAPHEWAPTEVLGADMFAESYTWFGSGSMLPDPEAQKLLNNALGNLATWLMGQ